MLCFAATSFIFINIFNSACLSFSLNEYELRQSFMNMQLGLPTISSVLPTTSPKVLRIVTFNVGRFSQSLSSNVDSPGTSYSPSQSSPSPFQSSPSTSPSSSFNRIRNDLLVLSADVIALQEIDRFQRRYFVSQMMGGGGGFQSLSCQYGEDREMLLLISKRLVMKSRKTLYFMDRCVILADIWFQNKRIRVANVHLSHMLRRLRNPRQLNNVMERLINSCQGPDFQSIIAGDFNMKDPLAAVSDNTTAFRYLYRPGKGEFSHWRGFTVDHILGTGAISVLKGGFLQQTASDHSLLYLDLTLQ